MNTYEASCHCDRQRLRYITQLPVEEWVIRSCQCSFCRRHGACTTRDPHSHVILQLDESALSRYRFGLETSDFLLCTVCGSYLGAVVEQNGRNYMTINTLNFVSEFRSRMQETSPITYDTEPEEERIRRRVEAWVPVVEESGT